MASKTIQIQKVEHRRQAYDPAMHSNALYCLHNKEYNVLSQKEPEGIKNKELCPE